MYVLNDLAGIVLCYVYFLLYFSLFLFLIVCFFCHTYLYVIIVVVVVVVIIIIIIMIIIIIVIVVVVCWTFEYRFCWWEFCKDRVTLNELVNKSGLSLFQKYSLKCIV